MNFRKYLTILIVPLTFILFSCGNMFNSQSKNIDSAQTKAYFSVKVSKISSNRTINHDDMYESDSTLIQALEDFSLTGKYQNEDNDKELLTAQTAVQLAEKVIEIDAGNWEFTLSAKYKGLIYKATKKVSIEQGKNNTASFILKPEEDVGGYQISYTMTATPISMVKATLTKADGSGTPIIQTITADAFETEYASSRRYAVFKRDISNSAERMETGSYSMLVEFFADQNDVPVNTREDYLYIQAGRMTYAVIAVDFNEVFSINYKDESGNLLSTDDFESGIIITKYSIRSEFNLPRPKASNKIFMGWKEMDSSGDFSSTYTNKIQKATTGNKVFVADFEDTALYVSGTGYDNIEPDEHGNFGDGSVAHPFESIDKACEKIIEVGTPDAEWTIYIDGDVTGPHTSNNKAGSRGENPSTAGDTDYGRSVISADITSDYAKSILLIGKTGLDTNGYPQDMLNRGLVQNSSTAYKDTGNVIAIATTVPVTIKNLKITGGNTASSSSTNTTNDPYYRNGGGLYVAEGANVTLDDGVLITKNKAYNGGAVYNAGTLTMVGSATIGDSSVTTYPQKGITATADLTTGKYPASNEYTNGGGIYNIGTLYLGTSDKDLTGGIYNSYGSYAYGGGLYNSGNGTIVMSSGKINYNDGQSQAGGVYLDSGTFTMTGGELFFNSTAGKGGGVYVNYDAIFYFGGGTISGNNANTSGGGVYIDGGSNGTGKMFMYGNAVIGNSSATSPAPEIISGETADEKIAMSDGCNMAPYGAGIYILGELYIGYSSQDVTAPLTGGIFYNSAKVSSASNGGALYIGSSGYPKVFMNSGTINYNYAREGEGIYLYSTKFTMSSLTVGSDTYIPEIPQNIRLAGTSYYINIDSLLDSAANGTYSIVPSKNSSGDSATSYSSNAQILKLTDAAKAQNITIDKVKDKFAIEPFTNPRTGIVSNWIIDSNGKLAQKAETINVSSSGTYTSISDAVAQMNDDTKDYIISISGEITGTQTIPETVRANSITIKGASSSGTTSVPGNGINANLADGEEGTALTINTNIPVTLSNIVVKGGHGTEKDRVIIGGGLLLGQNALVCLDNNTRILQNITYDKGDGTPGYGAGVYISDGAKLYENSDCHITENTATSRGAGIYIAAGGCLQTMAESGSYVTLNTFDTSFRDGDGNAIVPCGGAVYIDNGATHEMFGAWFRDNCQDVDNCLGSGIYLSANGNLKASGHTEVVVPNDIYLQDGAQIEIAAAISPTNPSQYTTPNITARLTPEIYAEGKTLLKSATGLTANTFTNALQKFEILPQDISGQKQYWILNTSGQLQKNAGTGISVTIHTTVTNDIQVTVTSNGTTIGPDTHFTGGSTLVFTVTDQTNFSNCEWTIDGEEENPTNEYSLSVDTSGWAPGTYVVYLEAQDKNGKYYSYTAQIKVGN